MEVPLVLKVSGRIINPDNPELVSMYAEVLRKARKAGLRIAVVVGGGPHARRYIDCATRTGVGKAGADIIGIEVARLNALLLALTIGGDAYLPIPRSIDELLRAWASGKVVVMGGLQPGQSTAGTAAVVAEILGAKRLLYATEVDGIYDKDPAKHPDARRLERVPLSELRRYIEQEFLPGHYELLDPIALGILKRSGIDVVVFNGTSRQKLERALRGEDVGTIVIPE
ncbi:MAG: UMP kinase [Thermoprotei archaeon]|nr:MAG: UMP kinase [Thermoprotei archaeon]